MAALGVAELNTGHSEGVKMAALGVAELNTDNKDDDAADFLLFTSKYHDLFLTVGNPKNDKVERIGVASLYLIANSTVFRKMLEDRKEPEAQIHITDVSPAIFKLMLRYVYRGVLPKMTAVETAGLALCADKYRIFHLLQEVLKLLIPTTIEDVFPALICVAYANFPDLEVHVTRIIQQETDEVVKSGAFLKLDENCLLYIVKQKTLNIDEAELWRNVVRWAEYQLEELSPATTVRQRLVEILKHVRLLTLTSEEILEHVLPTQILTSEEFMDLTLAVKTKRLFATSVLCPVLEKRNIYKVENSEFSKTCSFKLSDYYHHIKYGDYKCSTLILKPSKSVELKSFRCRSPKYISRYSLICTITATRTTNDDDDRVEVMRIQVEAGDDEEVILPIKLESGQPLIINPVEIWIFHLEFDDVHPVYHLLDLTSEKSVSPYFPVVINDVTFTDVVHVLQIDYREKP